VKFDGAFLFTGEGEGDEEYTHDFFLETSDGTLLGLGALTSSTAARSTSTAPLAFAVTSKSLFAKQLSHTRSSLSLMCGNNM
jgi:hypothetical protein